MGLIGKCEGGMTIQGVAIISRIMHPSILEKNLLIRDVIYTVFYASMDLPG